MQIEIENVTAPTDEVRALVGELEAVLSTEYEPHQRHGLPLAAIFQPQIRFFVARVDGAAAGCGGVALLDGLAELKRMYVREALRGRGVASALLARLAAEAARAGYRRLCLETGTAQHAALRFYAREGFARCGAFGAYLDMAPEQVAESVFMEKQLAFA